MMRPVRQAIVIADQVTMKFNRSLDTLASFPMIFADPGLNTEPTLLSLSALCSRSARETALS
jgi:hypothetical protein